MGGLDRLRYYSKYTIDSFLGSTATLFSLPLKRAKDSETNFLEDVINKTAIFTVVPLVVGAAVINKPVEVALIASNIFFLGYEAKRGGLGFWDAVSYVGSVPCKVVKRIARAPKKFVKDFRKLPQEFSVYACAYVMTAALAFGHYQIALHLPVRPGAVDIQVGQYTLSRKGKSYELYVVGEAHIYNKSSSEYVGRVIRAARPKMLLSEGMSSAEKVSGWRGQVENMLGPMYRLFAAGSGRNFPGAVALCHREGIPIVALDTVGENKARKGLSDGFYLLLGGVELCSFAFAPSVYFAAVPQRYLDSGLVGDMLPGIMRGAVDDRI